MILIPACSLAEEIYLRRSHQLLSYYFQHFDFMYHNKTFIHFLYLLPLISSQAHACDSCAIYSATLAQGESTTGWFAGAASQYTHFATTQNDGHEVTNEAHQYLDSSISQALAGYNFTPRISAQVNLPYIYRSFRRPEGFLTDKDTEYGIGDASLTGSFLITRHDTANLTYTWNLLAGIKLPTGNSSRLKEEFHESEVPGAPESGIHGHDLALGSGSWDGIVGTSAYYRYQHVFATASVQYSLRTEGDYNYRYANALAWESGIGIYLLLTDNYTVALELLASGDYKRTDTFQGEAAADTAINAVYLGPKLVGTWKTKLAADLGVEIPVRIQNSAFQTVPNVRVRAGFTWRF